jgi:hypothetical protein
MRLNSEYNGDQFKPFQNHAKTLLVSSDGPASRFAAPAGGAHFFMRDRFNKHRRGAPCRIVVRCAREMAATSSCPRYCGAAPHTPRASAKSSTVIDGIRPRKSGSHQTHRWSKRDSNRRSLSRIWAAPERLRSVRFSCRSKRIFWSPSTAGRTSARTVAQTSIDDCGPNKAVRRRLGGG